MEILFFVLILTEVIYKFEQNFGIELKQIKRGKHKEGVYHIQHINSYHSKLKKWMDRFNGVSTKYLSNYMFGLNGSNTSIQKKIL